MLGRRNSLMFFSKVFSVTTVLRMVVCRNFNYQATKKGYSLFLSVIENFYNLCLLLHLSKNRQHVYDYFSPISSVRFNSFFFPSKKKCYFLLLALQSYLICFQLVTLVLEKRVVKFVFFFFLTLLYITA